MSCKRLLYAPNIHQGGGKVLLLPLLEALKDADEIIFALDERLCFPDGLKLRGEVHRVKATLFSRLAFEWSLKALISAKTTVLCMGNLPPLFVKNGVQLVFVQNRYLIDSLPLDGFSWVVRLRIRLERLWLRSRARNVSRFIVQTTTMRRLLNRLLNADATTLPFTAIYQVVQSRKGVHKKFNYDFLYVATGEPHKNHKKLIEAWVKLAERGVFSSLCLTLDAAQFPELCAWINNKTKKHSLNIFMVCECSHEEIMKLYKTSRALVFPSLCESFGLPLIESVLAGLPVLASDLDYVTDIIQPSATFDPHSSHSIADAVCDFSFQSASLNVNLLSPNEFLQQTLNCSQFD